MQRHSDLEVCEVENEMEIQANKVYVMPENKVMSISNGHLILSKRDLSIKVNMAIDIFFKSLAKDTIFNKIAIILSGMGSDGTDGVKEIARNGGYIIAQIPESADQENMPLSVIKAGYVNEILKPKQMPQAIINYVETHYN